MFTFKRIVLHNLFICLWLINIVKNTDLFIFYWTLLFFLILTFRLIDRARLLYNCTII